MARPFDQDETVEEVACIRVDGLAFPVSPAENFYFGQVEAAQCSATDDCLSHLFQCEFSSDGAVQYRCAHCEEPYTVRLIPVTSSTFVRPI